MGVSGNLWIVVKDVMGSGTRRPFAQSEPSKSPLHRPGGMPTHSEERGGLAIVSKLYISQPSHQKD